MRNSDRGVRLHWFSLLHRLTTLEMRRNQEVLQWRDAMIGDDIERYPGSSQLDMELLQVKCFIDAMWSLIPSIEWVTCEKFLRVEVALTQIGSSD